MVLGTSLANALQGAGASVFSRASKVKERHMKFSRPIVASIALLFLSTAVPGAAAPAGDPIEIPVILPLTGQASVVGKRQQTTLAPGGDQVNKSGGVGGRPVKFVVQDDQSNP